MKTNIHFCLIVLSSLLIINNSVAQWLTDIRLTNDPASSRTSGTNVKCIASVGDIVHIFWEDGRNGNSEIYYIRSTDGGINWGASNRLTNSEGSSGLPALAVSGPELHIVWEDNRDGNFEIYYKYSSNAGILWGPDTRLTNFVQTSSVPAIALSGQFLYVAWVDYRSGGPKIYFKRSANGGAGWSSDTLLAGIAPTSICPTIAASGQLVHLAWMDTRHGNDEIYYKRSADGGASWQADVRMSFRTPISSGPCITAYGQSVHLAWSEPPGPGSTPDIFYKRSIDCGLTWLADTQLTNYDNASIYPSLAASGENVHLVWTDYRDANFEIYYKRSTNEGLSWNSDTRITNFPATSEFSHIAISGQLLHVAWSENHDGNFEIYYKQNPTGNPIGIYLIGKEVPAKFELYQNYPNPFNPITKIKFIIPLLRGVDTEGGRDVLTELLIFDILGREVKFLVNEALQPGTYEVDWDAGNYVSGVYFYRIEAGDFSDMKKMVLLK